MARYFSAEPSRGDDPDCERENGTAGRDALDRGDGCGEGTGDGWGDGLGDGWGDDEGVGAKDGISGMPTTVKRKTGVRRRKLSSPFGYSFSLLFLLLLSLLFLLLLILLLLCCFSCYSGITSCSLWSSSKHAAVVRREPTASRTTLTIPPTRIIAYQHKYNIPFEEKEKFGRNREEVVAF